MASNTMPSFINSFKSVKEIIQPKTVDPVVAIKDIVELANVARKEGLLALDDKSVDMDPFLRKGIMLVVDGTDQELVRNVLEIEVSFIEDRHKVNINTWDTFASMFPAWGMVGTLVGLVIMLQNMDDPSSIGPKMAVAIITTFYGSLFANGIATPIKNKLAVYTAIEVLGKEIIIEGILSIAAGENPRLIEEKLKVFIAPELRDSVSAEGGGE
ncbi:MAG: MotA/TolQ/ExbB proton channel family protein [bacterium]